jgi:arylsulfatase A
VHPTLIHDAGFDEYLMWAYKHNLPQGIEHKGGWEGKNKPARYWHPSLVRNGEYVPTTSDDYGPDKFTDYLIDFMRRNKETPFCAYYSMCLTHAPWLPTPDSTRSPADRTQKSKANFQANVEYVDKLVGRLVDALDELGLREQTIVIFTGDNGTGGDGKGQTTELGARVPLIVNCPSRVPETGARRELVDFSDVLPTLAALTGAKVPDDRPIDGRSFAHLLQGKDGPTRDWIFSYLGERRMLRDKRWLLEDNSLANPGRLYDCGESRNGKGYRDVTDSQDAEVLAARARFEKILVDLPAPIVGEQAAQEANEE